MSKPFSPTEISVQELVERGHAFSPSLYNVVVIPAPKTRAVREYLSEKQPYVRGVEPGSLAYMRSSKAYLMRTKVLQPHTWLPYPKGDSIVPVNPRLVQGPKISAGDILLSKDSNVGECAIVPDNSFDQYTFSGGVVRLNVIRDKFYLLAFLKHPIFKAQLDALTPKGSTIRHAKELWLDCRIPLPTKCEENVIAYVSLLSQALIDIEAEIRLRNQQIDRLIETELSSNQHPKPFKYEHPRLEDLIEIGRLDAGFYSEETSRALFSIQNYALGFKPIDKLGFAINRGQNLQVTSIGKSMYSMHPRKGFYRLAAPTDLSEFRTSRRFRYLGNPRALSVLKKGDVVFGAEGFGKGRTLIVVDEVSKTITNIHGIIFSHEAGDTTLSTFVGCFLGYLRKIGLVDALAAGGSGGSLAINYLGNVPIPLFPDQVKQAVSKMYSNPSSSSLEALSRETFLAAHREHNKLCGIWELDQKHKRTLAELQGVQDQIIQGKSVEFPHWWKPADQT